MIKKFLLMFISSIVAGAFAAPVTETVSEENKSKLVFLEYLEGSKKVGIETKYVPNYDTTVKFKGAFIGNASYYRLFASYNGEEDNACRIITQKDATKGIYFYCFWSAKKPISVPLPGLGTIFEGQMSTNSVTVNSQTFMRNLVNQPTIIPNRNNQPVYLFDQSTSDSAKSRIYYIEFLEKGVSVYRFLPCAYDNVVGVYDEVNSVFYKKSTGTGTISGHNFTVEMEASAYPMAVGGVTPDVIVRHYETGEVMTKGVDYTVTYSNNTKPGKATATVKHIDGSKCFGTRTINYNILYDYRVAPDNEVPSGGDGSSWDKPMTFSAAVAKAVAGDTIRMKAGTYTRTASLTIDKAITVYGGYKGEKNSDPADDWDLADDPVSTLDGAKSSSVPQAVYVTLTSGTTRFYRVGFIRCLRHGIMKSGAGSLEMYDCRLANNGATEMLTAGEAWGENVGGRGGLFNGSTTSSHLVLSNCVFEGNVYTRINTKDEPSYLYYNGCGDGASIWNFNRVVIDDCMFKSNGVPADCSDNLLRSGKAAALYVKNAPVTARNTTFKGNSYILSSGHDTGIMHLEGACAGSLFTNCRWIGNRGDCSTFGTPKMQSAVYLQLGNSTDEVDFENCTIAYNIMGTAGSCAAGLTAAKGTANVKNSILYGNVVFTGSTANTTDADIMAHANGKVNLRNSMTSVDLTGKANVNLEASIYGDPLFVSPLASFYDCIDASGITPISSKTYTSVHFKEGAYEDIMNLDVHLLSAKGYFDNAGNSRVAEVTSKAIDAGSVESDYSNEPMPNGGVVNLGCYGNTPEASQSPAGGQPTLAGDDVSVTFTEYGQPMIAVTPKAGDASVEYKATVAISVTGKVKGIGAVVEEVNKTYNFTQSGVGNGDPIEMAVGEIFEPSSQLTISVTVSAEGAQNVTVEKKVSVSGTLPECYGYGNNSVVHYWPEAPGRNDGSSWVHAYRDLSSALAALTPEKNELWIAGSNVLKLTTAATTLSFDTKLRGGFTEYSNVPDDREQGAISVLDGNNERSPLNITVSSGATCFIERVKFCRSATRNILKSGSGNLSMVNCIVSDCDKSMQGSGIYLSGGVNTFDSCEFRNLKHAVGDYHEAGAAMYVAGANKVILENCKFEGNGAFVAQNHRDAPGGSAIYSANAPIIASGCRFVGNVERTEKHTDFRSAGCVTVNGNCGGSAFTNCLWLGNCGTYSDASKVGTSTNAAAVVVNLSSASSTVDFANCTFAYNMSDSALSPTGILLLKGKGNAVNSIFTGAVTGAYSRVANQVYVNKGSSMTFDYCMFDGEGDYGAAEGGTVTASNIMYGDPRLVYSRDDFASGGNVDLGNGIYKSNGSGIASVLANANAHLRGGTGYADENTGLVMSGYRRDASPAIDAGKPGYDCSLEPQPNGRRVNLGFYGNTPWATMSDRRGMKIIIR